MSDPQVQTELALLRDLGRRRRIASLRMFAVRRLRQRVSLIVMPVIEQPDAHTVPVQRHRAPISRTRSAIGA